MSQFTQETARLLLRPLVVTDAPAVQRLASAREIADTTSSIPHPYPDGLAAQWIESRQDNAHSGEEITCGIVLRTTKELCGVIGIGIKREHQQAEMGYWVGVPYWGQGYATEAAIALVTYSFTTLGLHRIFARHLARNPASGRVMQKIGMTNEGRLRQHMRKNGSYEDIVYYGILRDEWLAQQARR